jgi:hypothetical protein
MRNLLKITALLVIVFAMIFVFWGKKFVWWQISATEIKVDGTVLPESTLYKSYSGDYVLMLEYDGEEQALYVIRPNEKKVGIQSRIKFSRTPFCLISFDDPVYPITSDSEKGSSVNPELVVEEKLVQFTVYPNKKIKATW